MRPGTEPPFGVTSYDLFQNRSVEPVFGGEYCIGPTIGKITAEIWFDRKEHSFNEIQDAFQNQKLVTWGLWAGENQTMYITGYVVRLDVTASSKNREWVNAEIHFMLSNATGGHNPVWEPNK